MQYSRAVVSPASQMWLSNDALWASHGTIEDPLDTWGAASLPEYQRSSGRWSVWWRSSQSHASSPPAARRSSTCGGSTCCTLCGPAWAERPGVYTSADSKIFERGGFFGFLGLCKLFMPVQRFNELGNICLDRISTVCKDKQNKKRTFFWRRQWKMKINIPWKVLKIVKRYAITMEASFMKKRPKDHVRPSRHSRAKAPMTQDLKDTTTNTGGHEVTSRVGAIQ